MNVGEQEIVRCLQQSVRQRRLKPERSLNGLKGQLGCVRLSHSRIKQLVSCAAMQAAESKTDNCIGDMSADGDDESLSWNLRTDRALLSGGRGAGRSELLTLKALKAIQSATLLLQV